jgi:DNA-binding MarR family transcriptional regulator/GNAT superfamily N-acetyltransferase
VTFTALPRRTGSPPGPSETALDRRVGEVRRFNRFYTQRIGVLRDRFLGEALTLSQSRILFEIAHRDAPTAGELVRDLGLDQGNVSRILTSLEKRGFVLRTPSSSDGRKSHLSLTDAGRDELATLDARSNEEVSRMLAEVAPGMQDRVLEAMRTIETALGGDGGPSHVVVRQHAPGDLGWIVERHGVLGGRDASEARAAGIVAAFAERRDERRERCWIAERNGSRAGAALLVARTAAAARIELLLVDPGARRAGVGRQIVRECVRFARQAGYRRVEVPVGSGERAAEALLRREGFQPAASGTAGIWTLTL